MCQLKTIGSPVGPTAQETAVESINNQFGRPTSASLPVLSVVAQSLESTLVIVRTG